MLKANIIEPSNSPYSVQGFFVHKVDPEVINPNLMPLNANETPVFVSTVKRRSSMEFNTLFNGFENLKKNSIFNSQKFKNSILESK
jgi:hypothetical protein